MKRSISISLSVFTCLCLLLATERRALAYINPGDGLLAIQSAGAFLAAAGYYMRRRILSLFGRGKKPVQSVPVPVTVQTVQKENTRNAA